jgi:hypothetical protein
VTISNPTSITVLVDDFTGQRLMKACRVYLNTVHVFECLILYSKGNFRTGNINWVQIYLQNWQTRKKKHLLIYSHRYKHGQVKLWKKSFNECVCDYISIIHESEFWCAQNRVAMLCFCLHATPLPGRWQVVFICTFIFVCYF